MTLALMLIAMAIKPSQALAQSTEERFHDLFVTAGYSTAFGAALGAAFLSFTEQPSSKLRYVAVGASLGFIGGSLFGSYVVFSPIFADQRPVDIPLLADTAHTGTLRLGVHPTLSPGDTLNGLGASISLPF